MTEPTKDEPAFPFQMHNQLGEDIALPFDIVVKPNETIQFTGMTMRDYFAAKALQAVLTGTWDESRDELATWCYSLADAMMKARSA